MRWVAALFLKYKMKLTKQKQNGSGDMEIESSVVMYCMLNIKELNHFQRHSAKLLQNQVIFKEI